MLYTWKSSRDSGKRVKAWNGIIVILFIPCSTTASAAVFL